MESEGDDKFTSGFMPMHNHTMQKAFETVANYQSDKAKDMFGFRRNTFQNNHTNSSVLSQNKGPLLGLDRIEKRSNDSAQRTSP